MKIAMLLAAATFALASPAGAVDLSQQFMDQDGHTHVMDELAREPSASCDGKHGDPCLTLGKVLYHALLQPYADEGNLSGEDKFKRGELAMRMLNKKEVAFSPQDVILLKTVIGKMYSPLIVVQAYKMLDPSLATEK